MYTMLHQLHNVFDILGIDAAVTNGASSLVVSIETTKGPWSIENEGVRWIMPGMLVEVARLWWQTRG